VQQAELFHEDDEIIDSLRFYSIVVSPSGRRRAVFFRTYSPKKELTRRAGFAALFRRGSYDKVDKKIFLFDHDTDCFVSVKLGTSIRGGSRGLGCTDAA
jgi:hypothetical protein